MSETTDTILAGLRGQVERLLAESRERGKSDTRQAVDAVKKAADAELQRIDKRIDALTSQRSLEPALWGATAGVLFVVGVLILGVWMGDRGVTVDWLLTFGWHL